MNWRLLKIFRRKRFYAFMVLPVIVVFLHLTFDLRLDDQALRSVLRQNVFQFEAEIDYTEIGNRSIRHVAIGADSLPLIVFIHGAPSSSAFWVDFLRDSLLLSQAKLMAVDRPGYGYSNFGKQLISVKEQARLIAQVIEKQRAHHRTIVLHGSSYGGPVAARIAMDYPDLVDGLLLQSASLAPGKEKIYGISYPTHHWSFRWLVPAAIRMANYEKLSHKFQLEEMEGLWHKIKSRVIIFHGAKDELIYPENALFAAKKMINAKILEFKMFAERRHDLLWHKPMALKRALTNLLVFPDNTTSS